MYKTRFSLLRENELEYVLNKPSAFKNNQDCLIDFEDILKRKQTVGQTDAQFCSTIRYCEQNMFNVLLFDTTFFGDYKFLMFKFEENKETFKRVKQFSGFFDSEYVIFKNVLYAFHSHDDKHKYKSMVVEKYSFKTEAWEKSEHSFGFGLHDFCACAFMNSIYLMGGRSTESRFESGKVSSRCIRFDVAEERFAHDLNSMIQPRCKSSCAAFEGRIVVCGGSPNDDQNTFTKTAEAYDRLADCWSPMPDMVRGSCYHHTIAVRTKLFAVGGVGHVCQVYDGRSGKFCRVTPPAGSFSLDLAVPMGGDIVVFELKSQTVAFYDVIKDRWSKKSYASLHGFDFRNCLRMPQTFF